MAILPEYSPVTNGSKITKLIPTAFQPGNLWPWSPTAGKETVMNYQISLLGIISVIVWSQIAEKNSLRIFPVGNVCVTMVSHCLGSGTCKCGGNGQIRVYTLSLWYAHDAPMVQWLLDLKLTQERKREFAGNECVCVCHLQGAGAHSRHTNVTYPCSANPR